MYSPERVLVTHETRELFQRSSGRMYCMCSEEMLSAPAASFGLCSQKALAAAQKLHKGTGHWHDKNVCSEKCRNHDSQRVWKPGEEAWVKSFDLVSTGDIVRPGSKSLTHG